MSEAFPNVEFDVDAILREPLGRRAAAGRWLQIAAGAFLVLIVGGALAQRYGGAAQRVYEVFSTLAMLGLMAGLMARSWLVVKAQRAEMERLEGVEELLQLRQWGKAGEILKDVLSRPARTAVARVQALLFLTTWLGRYHRFDEAVRVTEFLLAHVKMDPTTEWSLRVGRAMALLREDRLVDADRAMGELKRMRGDSEATAAGLALVELYRDVKTGHPYEAVEIFEKQRAAMTRQLGHRAGDAWVLVAKAYDQMGKPADAEKAYRNATLLVPPAELRRRYPETAALAERYPAAGEPGELK